MTTAPTASATEAHNADTFDKVMAAAGLFTVYPEVTGTLVQPRPGQVDKAMRIDRVLVPNNRLVSLGWTHGVIGVELKPTGAKLGPAVSQAMDYSRSTFTLPNGGFQVMPSWVFLYPFDKQHGDMASVMAQHRIGTASTDKWTMLALAAGEANVLRVSWDGTTRIGIANTGTKAGRR